MSIIISNQEHIKFFEHQLIAMEEEWVRYAGTKMNILIKEKKLFVGRVWGIEEKQGKVILRFKAGMIPRMKMIYLLSLVGKDAPDDSLAWDFTYKSFRVSDINQYSGKSTEITTIEYLTWNEDNWRYILVSGFELAMLNELKNKYLLQKKHPRIVVAQTDPPVDYLLNLKGFVQKKPGNAIINLDVSANEDFWKPRLIDNRVSIISDITHLLESDSFVIIQGPPGTGKTYLAAQLCAYYLSRNKSVCVTALTNRALMELAVKEDLQEAENNGLIFKTNLAADEKKELGHLNPADELSPRQGELLLATYYKLSQEYFKIIDGAKRFDFLIIEEASQAYLATIAMFFNLAKMVLIIGDHKQLTPIIYKPGELRKISQWVGGIINGLQTFAFNHNKESNRLIYTRRLTTPAADLTGLYYNNSLQSISELNSKIDFDSEYKDLFHPNGGVSIAKLSMISSISRETSLLSFLCLIALGIIGKNKDLEVALLSPYVDTEKDFYDRYSKISGNFKRITINTIHRIQGLTCDLTILYLPLTNASFELDANLFNVATSRAKMGTLIITYNQIELVSNITVETKKFISSCLDVTEAFNQMILG